MEHFYKLFLIPTLETKGVDFGSDITGICKLPQLNILFLAGAFLITFPNLKPMIRTI